MENSNNKAEYLYRNGRDTKNVRSVSIHPASPAILVCTMRVCVKNTILSNGNKFSFQNISLLGIKI